jgi:hypothetical protein
MVINVGANLYTDSTKKEKEIQMSVSAEYIQNLVSELDASAEERKASALPEPVMVVYGVGLDYEPCHRHFAKREDAEAFMLANNADYVEEIAIY